MLYVGLDVHCKQITTSWTLTCRFVICASRYFFNGLPSQTTARAIKFGTN